MPLVPHSTRHSNNNNNNRATKTATERSTKNRNQRAEAKLKTLQRQTEAGIVLNHLHFLLLLFCLCNQFSIIYVIIRGNRIWCRNRNRGSLALMPTIHSSRTLHLFNICVNASLTQLSRSSASSSSASRLPITYECPGISQTRSPDPPFPCCGTKQRPSRTAFKSLFPTQGEGKTNSSSA